MQQSDVSTPDVSTPDVSTPDVSTTHADNTVHADNTAHSADCSYCKDGAHTANATIDSYIAENGFAMVGVFDVDPPFAYTIGLTDLGMPELILVGNFSMSEFNGLLIDIGHNFRKEVDRCYKENKDKKSKDKKSKSGSVGNGKKGKDAGKRKIDSCNLDDVVVNIRIKSADGKPIEVPVGLMFVNPFWYPRLLGQALARYNGDIQCVQVFIPDPTGLLLWDDGYDEHWASHVMQLPLYGEVDLNDEMMRSCVARWCREDRPNENAENEENVDDN